MLSRLAGADAGQLLQVADMQGNVAEKYVYDPAGNILSKTIAGKTTSYTYDKANQLVSSTTDGKTTHYEYDAAGRLIKEGDKNYMYGYLDKVLAVRENDKKIASFDYQVDGQIAQAIHGDQSEAFFWDGLALIHRGETTYINEPYVTGGNPILSSKDGVMFNDMLGSTLNIGGKAIHMTAFGESKETDALFTGKPYINELGYAFLFRNYRADKGKWQTSDPLGYPDGWNSLEYCKNLMPYAIDMFGASVSYQWGTWEIEKIIGLNGMNASGYMYGDSVVIIWKIVVTWSCTDCCKTGKKDFYEATRYSNNDVVWSAPKAGLGLSVPTATTLPGVVGDFLASQLDDLIGKKIASGMSKSQIQDSRALVPPTKRPNFTHKCE